MYGADGYLVSELCLKDHDIISCETMEYLRGGAKDKVLSAEKIRLILGAIKTDYKQYYDIHTGGAATHR
jgi:hypothetical protein